MLPIKTVQQLRSLGIQATSPQDFANGVKLLQLVCHAYYKGENSALASKIKWSDDQKTGNKIVNINIILNYIKKDQNIKLPPSIRQLTAFKLIEEDQSIIMLIEHLLSQLHSPQAPDNYELSPPRQQQNQFDNLYFVASLQKRNMSEDSLQADNPADKVGRKGSFKILKPKVSSDSKSSTKYPQTTNIREQQISIRNSNNDPLKQIDTLYEANRPSSSLQQLNPRKTVPKALQRPPLYRNHRDSQEGFRQKHESLKQSRKQTPNLTASQTDRQTIIKNIQSISHQIAQEEKSLQLINDSIHESKPEPTKAKSSRKIFKMEIADIGQTRKRALVQWLIGINILSLTSTKFSLQLHKICKDGVIFMEVINYYRGRGRNICFFKEPKRSAEMHSNYQKLFALLQDLPDFRSQLLHQYEYFIPQAQPNAFWSMLTSIHGCFCKEAKVKSEGIVRYQNTVSTKALEKTGSRRKKMSEEISYQDVKFNSSSLSKDKKQLKNNFESLEIPRKETPKPQTKLNSEQTSQKQAYGLVQHEEPIEENLRTERGYKDLYLSKFKNIDTPFKNRSFTNNSSLSRSRVRSIGSAKKQQVKPVQPSVSLQMQMTVLKYLATLSVGQEQQLFKDPHRNGILICHIINKQWGVQCFASKKPKNIDDCRNNFLSAIEVMKRKGKSQVSYEYFVEELVKGQKNLLYGLIWSVLKQNEQSKHPFSRIEIDDKPLGKSRQGQEFKISWVRSIQKHCPEVAALKIRNQQTLYNMVLASDFLFHYACFITSKKAITPNYERPFNKVQKESNLKKVLSYLIQNKIIRSDYLWKCKSLLNKQASLENLVNDLISHYNRLYHKEQLRTVNFVRYIKREQSQERQKPQEKLQTTMANQTINNQTPLLSHPQLEINWMRKLGFKGNLELNNGVILCRLVAKLGMKTIQGVNQNPQSRAECLGNIRRAIKQLPKFKWDEYDIAQGDYNRCLQVYAFLRDHFKHCYALKSVL